jgi:hypothetical protein
MMSENTAVAAVISKYRKEKEGEISHAVVWEESHEEVSRWTTKKQDVILLSWD